jgi:hypothetical protein
MAEGSAGRTVSRLSSKLALFCRGSRKIIKALQFGSVAKVPPFCDLKRPLISGLTEKGCRRRLFSEAATAGSVLARMRKC